LYEKEKEWKSAKHWQVTRDRIKKICTEAEWKYIRNITASSFRQWRARQDLSAKTLNDYLSMLKAFIKWMIESGYIKESPLACISNLKRNGHTFERLALSPAEFQSLIDSIKDTNKRLCYLTVCYTGFRRAEMEALEWGDIRLSRNVAYIAARASTTKNGKSAEQPIPDFLADALRAYKPIGARQTDTVFDVPTIKVFKSDLRRAGISYKDSRGNRRDFHSLRKMFNTLLQVQGTAPRIAQELMRHSDIKLTMGVYTDARMLPKHEEVNRLPNFLGVYKNVHTEMCTTGKRGFEDSENVLNKNPQKPNEYGHKKTFQGSGVHERYMVPEVGLGNMCPKPP
jgi:integrase